jgi:hypothetical protein
MSTVSDQLRQWGGASVSGPLSHAQAYFVRPGTGSDGNSGKKPNQAVATWSKAQSLVTADSGSVIYVISEDNSASGTTDYLSAALTLSKDGIKWQGDNAGGLYGQRSRLAQLSTVKDIENLLTISGNNCLFSNLHVLHGVASSTATSPIAVTVSGDRNHFYRCHFAGMGDTAGDMDTAGARHLKLTGDENFFEECVIGIDTVSTSTAAYGVEFSGGATRNIFKNCIFPMYSGDNGSRFIGQAASGIDRFNIFEDCLFYNAVNSGATIITEAFNIAAGGSPAGGFILKGNCLIVGATEWDAGDEGNLWIAAPTGAVATQGIAVEPAT